MKIIFLDIDGVLATNKEFATNRTKFREKYLWAKELRVPYKFNKPEKWIAIDDMNLSSLGPNFFRTKDSEGLKQSGLKDKIIKILNDDYTTSSI
jgi:FMN phosphatase YigB (HAD superfamily)